jgi:16S rRNA processing protein RimM
MVTVGRIIRPQHNRGQVMVASDTDFADERFAPGSVVYAWRDDAVVPLTVTESREHDGRWVVLFEGVGSINDAETLRGLELRIPAESLRRLPAGSYYTHDLVGCEVYTVAGERVGVIERVDLGTGIPMLVITGTGGEVLVPFTDAFCRRVDVVGRTVEIDPPAGLLELNVR